MFVVTVDLNVKPASEQALHEIFKTVFVPAISEQKGFAGVHLLRPEAPGSDYLLVIEFDNQTLQQTWVATPLHQKVWPQMEDCCTEYKVQSYTSV